jgi:hypothetical protein
MPHRSEHFSLVGVARSESASNGNLLKLGPVSLIAAHVKRLEELKLFSFCTSIDARLTRIEARGQSSKIAVPPTDF